jgi:hypothetical protein
MSVKKVCIVCGKEYNCGRPNRGQCCSSACSNANYRNNNPELIKKLNRNNFHAWLERDDNRDQFNAKRRQDRAAKKPAKKHNPDHNMHNQYKYDQLVKLVGTSTIELIQFYNKHKSQSISRMFTMWTELNQLPE